MKKFFIITLLFILGCNACQNASPTSIPPNAPEPTFTLLPTDTPTPTLMPPTPTVKIMAKNLIERGDLRTGKGPVYSQDWSADGHWLVTADFDQVRVWDTTSYREAGVLEGHTDFIWGLAWSPINNSLASASQDGSVRLWDVETYTQTTLLETGWAFCVDWSPDGKQLAVGIYTGEIQIRDAAEGRLLRTRKSETPTPIISIAWSPDGKTIAAGELDGEIYWWEAKTGKLLHTITGYTSARSDANGLAWSPDGSLLASAHQDGKVRLWNAETFELARTLTAHKGWVRGVAFSPDGRLLASTGEDKRICLWDVASGQKYAEQHHNSLPVWSVSWSPDGKFVASGAGAYQEPHVGATIVWQVP